MELFDVYDEVFLSPKQEQEEVAKKWPSMEVAAQYTAMNVDGHQTEFLLAHRQTGTTLVVRAPGPMCPKWQVRKGRAWVKA